MSRSQSSVKRLRQSIGARTRNRRVKGVVKSLVRIVEQSIKKSDKESLTDSMRHAISALDSAARKRVLKKNAVARKKSRLQLKINKLLKAS